ncbi:MAG: hypothetical protein DI582_01350 [Azospirillum brasilense]|nr:MAG: hypothetical protein DI582_01350 [Azospirillum brasilense]
MENAKDLLLSTGQLALNVTPKTRREGIEGVNAAGALVVKVRAAPEDGAANAAVIALLAAQFGLPKSSLSITKGVASRHKIIAYRPR